MKQFEENLINQYGQEGRQWLTALPRHVAVLAEKYRLTHLRAMKGLSYNYVASSLQDSMPVVLKLGFDKDNLTREGQALKAFSGFGVVQLLAEEEGRLLLEQAVSGAPLDSLQDADAVDIACRCLMRLHQAPIPPTSPFPHIREWLLALDTPSTVPSNYLYKARVLRDNLLRTSEPDVLLHGDLHHANILQQGDDWLVIDPKGVIGEPAYDVPAFIRNPIPALLANRGVINLINSRITHFSHALKVPRQQIVDWCYVQAVLAWIWILEDRGDDRYFKQLVALFDML